MLKSQTIENPFVAFLTFLTLCLGLAFSTPASAMMLKDPVKQSAQSEKTFPVLTVNINQATAEELAEIMTGVGIKKASLIVEYRETHGKFKTLEDLLAVKGIGEATLNKNRNRLKL